MKTQSFFISDFQALEVYTADFSKNWKLGFIVWLTPETRHLKPIL